MMSIDFGLPDMSDLPSPFAPYLLTSNVLGVAKTVEANAKMSARSDGDASRCRRGLPAVFRPQHL
jgi:hypothetical protein